MNQDTSVKSMTETVQKLVTGVTVCLFIVFLAFFTFYAYVVGMRNEHLQLQAPIEFQVHAGENFYNLIDRFAKENLIEDPWRLIWLARFDRRLGDIKQGLYLLQPNDTLGDVFSAMIEGREMMFQVTFIEGSRIEDAISILAEAPRLKKEIDLSKPLLQQLDIDEQHPEGFFFPDTYSYRAGDSDKVILKKAYTRLKKELEQVWLNRAEDLPYQSPYELLIMASIIEKETSVEAERSLVSAVFVNRLRKKMRLQTDPTVIYGMGKRYKGNIKRKHLREKTAYNTYQIKGLPPTPIALSGRASIDAAAHPAHVPYLFFVAKKNGYHHFSQTLAEHESAVDEYQRNIKRKKKRH
ncbi:MAG: endolytic transglycosylase MltG [Shewanellaceae bacterium]|nr:endolytic transglycosylase MltG [Shewanellaceae bacterium]